jgi:flagellar basal body P-ring formation protein FlgA
MKRLCFVFLCMGMWLVATDVAQARPAEKTSTPPYQLMLPDLEQAVGQALVEADVAEHVKVQVLSDRKQVVYASHHPVDVELAQLAHDTNKRTWTASMVITHNGQVVTAKPLSGRYEEQSMIPMLVDRIHHGDVITADNIRMVAVSKNKIRADVVTDPTQLEGKTSRSTIAGGRIIRASELITPAIMKKGAAVTMTYETPTMHISTVGEAMEDGGLGDMIKVRNSTSNMIVRAKILSSSAVTASLHTPSPIASTTSPIDDTAQHSYSGY